MCKTRELEQELKETMAELEAARETVNQPLESPLCYALPLSAFVLGFAFHKKLPKAITTLSRLLLLRI